MPRATSYNGGHRLRGLRVRYATFSVYAALLVGLVIFAIFWLFPLAQLDKIVTPFQNPEFSDSNFYLYHAEQNCNLPAYLREYKVTWSSTGVVKYLTYSCLITTSYLGFIISNSLVLVISYAYYLRSFRNYRFSKAIIYANALSIYTFTLLLTPGKEIISFASLCLVTGSVNRIESVEFRFRRNFVDILVLMLGFFVAASSRLHEAAILIVGVVAYVIYRKFGLLTLLVFATVVAAVANIAVKMLLGDSFQQLVYFGANQAGLRHSIAEMLTSSNPLINALLSPIRVLAVPLGSFLQLTAERTIRNDYYFMYRDLLQRFRAIDMTIFFLGLYYAGKRRHEPMSAALIITVVSLSAITWPGVIEKSRYYFVYVPLLTPFIALQGRRAK